MTPKNGDFARNSTAPASGVNTAASLSRPHSSRGGGQTRARTVGRIATPESTKTETLLLVSPLKEDERSLDRLLSKSGWNVRTACTCREGVALLRKSAAAVVICERDLSDGDWRQILAASASLASPPSLIVVSRLADEYLWAEVLNLGGWDVLSKPFREEEVLRAIDSAWRHWISLSVGRNRGGGRAGPEAGEASPRWRGAA